MLRSLIKDSAVYAAADLLVKSTQLVLTPYYLTRLSVEEFGHFGVIVAVLALGAAFFNLGFQSGLIRFYHLESERRGELLASALVFLTLTSLMTVPALAWAIHRSGVFTEGALSFSYVLLLVIASALFGIFINNGIALLKVRREPLQSGLLGFLASTTSLVTIIFLVEGDTVSNLQGIVLGQLMGLSVGTLTALILLRPLLSGSPSLALFVQVLRYSHPLIAHNVLQWILNSADRFILVRVLGAEALGGYFFAYQFGTALKLIGRSVNSSLLHVYSELAADPEVAPKARFASGAFLWAVLALFLVLGFAAPLVIWATPWAKFDQYLYLVPMVSAGAALYLVYYLPMNVLSLTLGRSRRIYLVTLVAATVSVGLNVLLVPRGVLYAGVVNVLAFGVLATGFLAAVMRVPAGRSYLPIAMTLRFSVVLAMLGLAAGLGIGR